MTACAYIYSWGAETLRQIGMNNRDGLAWAYDHVLTGDPSLMFRRDDVGQIARQAIRVANYRQSHGPASVWRNAKPCHPAVYRALKVSRKESGAPYACIPFRLAHYADEHVIVVATRPDTTHAHEISHDLGDILIWRPQANTVEALTDAPAILTPEPVPNALDVHGDPFSFFRSWIEERAAHWVHRCAMLANKWAAEVEEPVHYGRRAALVLTSDLKKAMWPLADKPATINCVNVDRKAVLSLIFRSMAVPRITGSDARRSDQSRRAA